MQVWPWPCKRLRGVDKPKNILEAYTTMINVAILNNEGYVYMHFLLLSYFLFPSYLQLLQSLVQLFI